MSNSTAAVLIIGNEILSGRTQDRNLKFLAKGLSDIGIQVTEARFTQDNEVSVVTSIQHLSSKHTYLFTTGGIGGTHDDITSACVAKAFHRSLEVNSDAFRILQAYYGDRLNAARSRMALMPTGVCLINNPVSAAPGFRIENTFVLAGVPMVMQAMFDQLIPSIKTGNSFYHQTVTCDLGEGTIADKLADVQSRHCDVEIGSYPFFKHGQLGTSLVMRGINQEKIQNAVADVTELISSLGAIPVIESEY